MSRAAQWLSRSVCYSEVCGPTPSSAILRSPVDEDLVGKLNNPHALTLCKLILSTARKENNKVGPTCRRGERERDRDGETEIEVEIQIDS